MPAMTKRGENTLRSTIFLNKIEVTTIGNEHVITGWPRSQYKVGNSDDRGDRGRISPLQRREKRIERREREGDKMLVKKKIK